MRVKMNSDGSLIFKDDNALFKSVMSCFISFSVLQRKVQRQIVIIVQSKYSGEI